MNHFTQEEHKGSLEPNRVMANVSAENSELQSRKNELSSQILEEFPLQITDVLLSSDQRTEEFPLQRTDVLLSSDHRTEEFPLQRTDVLLSSDHTREEFPLQRTDVLLSSDHRTEEFPLQRTDVLLSSDNRTEEFPLQRTDVLLSSDHRTEEFPLQRTDVLLSSDHRTKRLWPSPSSISDICITRSESATSHDGTSVQQVPSEECFLFSHEPPPLELSTHNSFTIQAQNVLSQTTSESQSLKPEDDNLTTRQLQPDHDNVTTSESQYLQPEDDNLTTRQLQPDDDNVTTRLLVLLQPEDDNLTTRQLKQVHDNLATSGSQHLQPNALNVTTKEAQPLESEDDDRLTSEVNYLEPDNYKLTTGETSVGHNLPISESQPLEPEDFSLSREKGIHNLKSSEPQASETENHSVTFSEPQASETENHSITFSEPQASETENHSVTFSEPQASETENHSVTFSEPQASETENHPLTSGEPHQEGPISLHWDLLPLEPKNCISSESHSLEPEDLNCIKSEYHVLGSGNNCLMSQVEPLLEPEHYGFIAAQSYPLPMVDSKSQINTSKYNFPFGNLPELRIVLQKCDVPKVCLHHMSANQNKRHVGSAAGHEQVAMNGLTQPVEVLKLKDEPLLPVKRKVGRPRKCIREKLEGLEKAEADSRNRDRETFNYQFKLRETDLEKIKEQSQFYDEFKLRDIDVIVKSPSKASNLRFQNSQSTKKRSNSKKAHVIDENTRNEEVECINNDVKLKKKRRGKKAKIDAGKNDTVKENTWAIRKAWSIRKAKCHLNGENQGSESYPEHATTLCKAQADCAKQVPGKRPRGRPPKKGNRSESSPGHMSTYDLVSGHSSTLKTKVKCRSKENNQKLHVRAEWSAKRRLTVSSSPAVGAKKPKSTLQKLRKTKKRSKLHERNTFKMDKIRKFHLRSIGEGRMLRSKNAPDAKAPVKKKGKFVSKKKANPEEAERCESPDYDPTSPIVEMDHDAEVDFETLFPLGMENFNSGGTPKKLRDQSKKNSIEKQPRGAPYPFSFNYTKPHVGKACDLSHACCHKCAQTKVDMSTQWEDPTEMFAAIDAAVAAAHISPQFIPQIKRYLVTESTQYQQQPYPNPPLKVQEKPPTLHRQPSQTCHIIQSDAVSPALQSNQLSAARSHSYSQQSPLNVSYDTQLQKFISQNSLNFQQSQTQPQVRQVSPTVLNQISKTFQMKQVSQVLQADATFSPPATSQTVGLTSTTYHNFHIPNSGGVSSTSHSFFSNNYNMQVPVAQMGPLTSGAQMTPFLLVPMTAQNLKGLSGHQTKTRKRRRKQNRTPDTSHLQSHRQTQEEVRGPNKGSNSSSKSEPNAGNRIPPVPRSDVVLSGGRADSINSNSDQDGFIGLELDPPVPRSDVVLSGGRADSNSDHDGFIGLELDVSCVEENENSGDSFKNAETAGQNDSSTDSVDCTDYIYIE